MPPVNRRRKKNMAMDDSDVPDTGAVFTFGKSRFADNTANKFWIRNDNVVQVSCGDDHTAFVTESGRIFTFGANEWGQLGLGHTKSTNKPGSIKALKHEGVVMVGCGRLHTLVYTRNDKLYGFGAGGEGQLGVASMQGYETPQQIEALEDVKVKMISCGTEHSAVLTADGSLYMFGSGSDGQLGLGETTETDVPRPLSVGVPIKHVSCGYYHTAVVTDEGKLYTFGENEFGKLGLNDNSLSFSKTPQHVSLIKERVRKASCGNSHTAVVAESGSVYTWGDGSSGQLGHGPSILELTIPQKIMRLSRRKCREVMCGESHTAVITDNGSLYMFGDGRHGKLCQGDESFSNLFQPTKVRRFKGFHVEQVSCGGCQTIVRARRNNKSNGHVSSDSDGETDPLRMSGQNKKGLLASALRNDQGVDSVDLGGSLDHSARGRRRQRETSPLPPLARTLPPLGSSKAGALHSLNSTVPGHGRKLDQSLIPNIRHDENEVHEETISKQEVKVVEAAPRLNLLKRKDVDPLESTHFSASKTVRELKPLLDAANGNVETEESGTRPETEGVDEIDSGDPVKSKENAKPMPKKGTEIEAAITVPNKDIVNTKLGSTNKVIKPENHDSGADSEGGDDDDDDEDEDEDGEDEDEDDDDDDVKAIKKPNRFVDFVQTSRPTPTPRARTQAKNFLDDEDDDDGEEDDEDDDEDDSEAEKLPAKKIQTKGKAKPYKGKRSDEDDKEDKTTMSRTAEEKTTKINTKQTKVEDDDEEDDDDDDYDDEEDDEDDDEDEDDEDENENEEDKKPTEQKDKSSKKPPDKEDKEKRTEVKNKKKGKKGKEAGEDGDGEGDDEKKEDKDDGEKDDYDDEEDAEGTDGVKQPGEPKTWQFWKKKTPAAKVEKSSSSVSSEEKPTNQNKSKTCSIL